MDRSARQIVCKGIAQARQRGVHLIQETSILAQGPLGAAIGQPTPHGRPDRIGAFQIKISRRQVKPRQHRPRRRLIGR